MGAEAESPLYLVLDQGGHGSRALVFDGVGNRVCGAQRPLKSVVRGVRVELDGDAVVQSLHQAAHDAVAQLGERARNLERAALATQRSNVICWHRGSGRPLSPVLSWQDRRAAAAVAALDPQPIHRKTGLFPNAHYGASKLAWCLEHMPAVREAYAQGDLMLGPMASFVASRLTGSSAMADPVNASRTMLWNVHRRDWDSELCVLFGVEEALLPPCTDSDRGFGELSLGKWQVPLSVVTGDLAAAAFADGMPDPQAAYITLGTGAFVQRVVTVPTTHPRLLEGVLWSSSGDQQMSLEGTVNGAGSALSWLARQQAVAEGLLIQRLAGWMGQVSEPPLFLNAVSGLGSPFWCAAEPPRFDRDASLAEQAVAVVESILFLLHLNMVEMERVVPEARQIVVSGGLARFNDVCQRLSDLSALPVVRSDEHEGTARGLAYLLCRPGDGWSQRHSVFQPAVGAAVRKRYQCWLAFLQRGLSERCLYSVV